MSYRATDEFYVYIHFHISQPWEIFQDGLAAIEADEEMMVYSCNKLTILYNYKQIKSMACHSLLNSHS